MDCVPLVTWLFSAAGVVAILEWMKRLPKIGPWITANGTLLSALLAALSPFVAQSLVPYCGQIDRNIFLSGFFLVTFILSQIEYKLAKRVGVV